MIEFKKIEPFQGSMNMFYGCKCCCCFNHHCYFVLCAVVVVLMMEMVYSNSYVILE